MKIALITVFLVLSFCCANASEKSAPLDGKTVVLKGRWNHKAKNPGQIICSTEPKIVEVSNTIGRPTPAHDDFIRVTGVLHWRPAPKVEEDKAEEMISDPGVCDCYYIDWSTAKWEKLTPSEKQKKEANQAVQTTAMTPPPPSATRVAPLSHL
jgi:hypothetical protein